MNIQRKHERASHSRDTSFDSRINRLTFKYNKHANMERPKVRDLQQTNPIKKENNIIGAVYCPEALYVGAVTDCSVSETNPQRK